MKNTFQYTPQNKQLYESLHDLIEVQIVRRLPAVARLSGRDGLEQVLPAVLDSLMVLSTDAQVSQWHLQRLFGCQTTAQPSLAVTLSV